MSASGEFFLFYALCAGGAKNALATTPYWWLLDLV